MKRAAQHRRLSPRGQGAVQSHSLLDRCSGVFKFRETWADEDVKDSGGSETSSCCFRILHPRLVLGSQHVLRTTRRCYLTGCLLSRFHLSSHGAEGEGL